MNSDQWIIETEGLHKSFGSSRALNGLDLRVPPGSIFGFLGKNGAGKTTTIEILLNVVSPDGGSALLFGEPVTEKGVGTRLRQRIGFVSEDKGLYPYMTVGQVVKFTQGFFPNWSHDGAERYLDLFELPAGKKVEALSKGQNSKLMLLLALARGADLLILDEPTDGLDPSAVDLVLRELVSVAANGTTIFFSSHQLEEVEQIADQICIISEGRAVVAGALDDLKTQYRRIHVVVNKEPVESMRWVDGVVNVRREGRTLSLLVSRNLDSVLAQARALPGACVEQFPVNLKDIFLETVRVN